MKISNILFFPKDINYIQFSKANSLARIIFGLILMHRFIDLYFSSSVPVEVGFKSALLGIFLSIFTTIGLFTPISLPFLSLMNWFISNNLASQIVSIITLLLFFSHSWKFNSLDNFLRKRSLIYSKVFKKLEFLYIRTHILRTFAIWLWGGVCFSALAFHFTDKSWLSGTAVLTLLRTPYLNDYYHLFNNLNDNLLLYLSKVSLYGMAIWELFLWIIPGIKIICKITFWWGITFFLSSILFINLSYLPYLEIVMWLIIYKPNIFLLKNIFKSKKRIYKTQNNEHPVKTNFNVEIPILSLGLVSILYMNTATTFSIHGNSKNIRDTADKMIGHMLPRFVADIIFGQYPVNVFNQDDLTMNRYSILICRNYQNGNKELVPFQDSNGGRLSYLANDNFYFSKSLKFQRGTTKLESKEVYRKWLDLSKDIASFDYSLQNINKIKNYKILLLEHNPNYLNQNILAGWNKYQKANVVFSKIINSSNLQDQKRFRISIPPGHFNEKIRIEQSKNDFC